MSERIWQALVVLAFAVCAVLAIRLLDRPNPVKQAKPAADSVDVVQAIAVGQERVIGVTGYLFEGGGWEARLCQGRRRGSPPRCVGPFLYAENIDVAQFNVKAGRLDGKPARWVDEQVTLLGRVRGTTITVSQVLSTPK